MSLTYLAFALATNMSAALFKNTWIRDTKFPDVKLLTAKRSNMGNSLLSSNSFSDLKINKNNYKDFSMLKRSPQTTWAVTY